MQIITANHLGDGLVVYLTPVGWVRDITRAQVFADARAAAAGLARAGRDVADNIVVEPYQIDVAVADGAPVPVRLRERIRVSGPTTGHATAPATPVPGSIDATAHAA